MNESPRLIDRARENWKKARKEAKCDLKRRVRIMVVSIGIIIGPSVGFWLLGKKDLSDVKDAVCWGAVALVVLLASISWAVAIFDIWENYERRDPEGPVDKHKNGGANEDGSSESPTDESLPSRVERYQAGVQLLTAEGREIWARHGFMAVLNTLVVTLIGVQFTRTDMDSDLQKTLIFASVAFGLVLCILWLQMMVRRWGYYDYYEAVCKELEGEGEGPFYSIEGMRRGRGRAWNNKPYLEGKINISMPLPGRLWGQRWFSYFIIMVFGLLYTFLLLVAIQYVPVV